mgnify:CR=1 FL=1
MEPPHKIWIEQCDAAQGIEDEFGTQKALEYLVGEQVKVGLDVQPELDQVAALLTRGYLHVPRNLLAVAKEDHGRDTANIELLRTATMPDFEMEQPFWVLKIIGAPYWYLSRDEQTTLIMITTIAVGLLMTYGLLEYVRSRMLVRTGLQFDDVLSSPLFHRVVKMQLSHPGSGNSALRSAADRLAPSALFWFDDRAEAVARGRGESLNQLILAQRDGAFIRLEDVGHAEMGKQEVRSYSFFGGQRALTFSIRKQSGSNVVAVLDGVLAAIDELIKEFPKTKYLVQAHEKAALILLGKNAAQARARFSQIRRIPGVPEETARGVDYWLIYIEEQQARTKADLERVMGKYETLLGQSQGPRMGSFIALYGVRRTNTGFWEIADWFHDQYARERPVLSGLFDLNRYRNR